jgi:acetyl-CoA carboxylase biotin carboxyl carrier protein
MVEIRASVTGSVWKILVSEGDEVSIGDDVIILESMKMEMPVEAERNGKVARILVEEGDSIQEDDPILELEE